MSQFNLFRWNIFMNDCKILEIKDPQNLALTVYRNDTAVT